MKKKFILLFMLWLLFLAGFASGQTAKGVTVTSTQGTGTTGKTWAVIVGISRYKNVQSLNFADRDAQAFYDYLTAADGGPKLDTAHVKLLKNENATSAEIYGALDWLIGSVKENDRVFIYFSGHGDLEKETIKQNGFLLAYDSPRAAYMTTGTISIGYLQDFLETYIVKDKAKDVILFADACRSGKLAGGEQGLRVTMHALGENWNNQIIKILSAQEGELSYEDRKWGRGRGVFSYYLMQGIEGLADRNNDDQITTSELALYLSAAVGDATGNIQNPKIDGNPQDILFKYDPKLLASVKKEEEPRGQIVAPAGRGTGDKLPPDVQIANKKYLEYLHRGRLLWGASEADTINCARHIYWQLMNNPAAESIRASLKSSFIAALQRKTNENLDAYLKGKRPTHNNYETFKEISYAKNLISPDYILYNYILARAYYAESHFVKNDKSSVSLLKKTLELEENAPYALEALGFAYEKLQMPDSAIICFKRASLAAPQWAYPCVELGILYTYFKENFDEAFLFLTKAIDLDSTSAAGYLKLGELYLRKNDFNNATSNFRKAASIDSTDNEIFGQLGFAYLTQKDYKEVISNFRKAISIDTTTASSCYFYSPLGYAYVYDGNFDKGVYYLQKALLLWPDDPWSYYNLACAYSLGGDSAKGLDYLKQSLQKGFKDYDHIQQDTDIASLKKLPEFTALMKQFFPDKFK